MSIPYFYLETEAGGEIFQHTGKPIKPVDDTELGLRVSSASSPEHTGNTLFLNGRYEDRHFKFLVDLKHIAPRYTIKRFLPLLNRGDNV